MCYTENLTFACHCQQITTLRCPPVKIALRKHAVHLVPCGDRKICDKEFHLHNLKGEGMDTIPLGQRTTNSTANSAHGTPGGASSKTGSPSKGKDTGGANLANGKLDQGHKVIVDRFFVPLKCHECSGSLREAALLQELLRNEGPRYGVLGELIVRVFYGTKKSDVVRERTKMDGF